MNELTHLKDLYDAHARAAKSAARYPDMQGHVAGHKAEMKNLREIKAKLEANDAN